MISKVPARLVTSLLALSLLPLSAVGCSSFSHDTCDGRRPIADPDVAIQGILQAAEENSFDKACSVMTMKQNEDVIHRELVTLKSEMDAAGITSENFAAKVADQGGSAYYYKISDGESSKAVDLTLISMSKGYRVAFGPGE